MASITLNMNRSIGVISRHIYGHFAEHIGRCVYQGVYVGEDSLIPNVNGMRTDVVEALKAIHVPVLRWPGGCFADSYHWEDGVGPREKRRKVVNDLWGGVLEDNAFGTHEFMELCRQLGCEAYITGNLGSGTVREMADWVEYLNGDGQSDVVNRRRANGREEPWAVRFWGVGNESWGCGGNLLADEYAREYRRYQTFLRNWHGTKLYRIACGPGDSDESWTDTLMRLSGKAMDGLSMHYYTICGDWADKGSATQFTLLDYYRTLFRAAQMDGMIARHSRVMDRYDPEKRVGLIVDEWGTWFNVEPDTNPAFLYQQNTMRDALVAAVTLNIFNRRCDRVAMANLAQMVNVLQSVVLTEGERMVLTPTYHVFDLFAAHQDAREIDCHVEADNVGMDQWIMPQLSASASERKGVVTVTAANLSTNEPLPLTVQVLPRKIARITGRVLSGHYKQFNDFDSAELTVKPFTNLSLHADGVAEAELPPCSVVELRVETA